VSEIDREQAAALLADWSRQDGLAPPELGEDTQILRHERAGDLVGLALLNDYGSGSEAGLWVRPDARRAGVGRALLAAITDDAGRRGRESFLLVCDRASASGEAFARAVGAQFAFAEHAMALDAALIERRRPRVPGLRLVPADPDEAEMLAGIQAAAFNDPLDEARRHVARGLATPTQQYVLGELNGEPVGLLRIGRYPSFADVTAFGVLPERQRRGIGRQMLLAALDILLADGWRDIRIEVESENHNALRLYESCGFRVRRSFGYYRVCVTG
jgi:ribosomal protein S18 acetylase RimI-like enzyme